MTKVFLFSLLILAFLLRFWGLLYESGSPPFDPFENYAVRTTLFFYQGHYLPPTTYKNYQEAMEPPLGMYLTALAGHAYTTLKYVRDILIYLTRYQKVTGKPDFTFKEVVFVARIISVLGGTASVYLIYLLGKAFRDKRTAWVSAIFLMAVPLSVITSHQGGSAALLTFLICLSLFFCIQIFQKGERKYYFLAGFFSSLTVGCHYTAFAVYVPLLVAHWLRSRQEGKKFFPHLLNKKLGFMIGGVVGGWLLSCPLLFFKFNYFKNYLPVYLRCVSGFALPGAHFYRRAFINLARIVNDLIGWRGGMSIGLTLLALAGLSQLCLLPNRRRAILNSFLLAYIVIILFGKNRFDPRDIIVLVPFICFLAAVGATALLDRLIRKRWLRTSLLFLLTAAIVFPLLKDDLQLDYCFWRKNTRELTQDWILQNIPPGSRIATESGSPALPRRRYLLEHRRYLCEVPLAEYQGRNFDYLLSTSLAYGRFLSSPPFTPVRWLRKFYQDLDRELLLLKTFRTKEAGPVNPIIKIYALERKGPGWKRKLLVLRDLDYDYSDSSPGIMVLAEDLGYEGKSGFWVRPGEKVSRLLIAPRRLEEIGVKVFPTAANSEIKIRVGREKKRLVFQSLSPRVQLFPARLSFPFLRYSYRLRVKSTSGHAFLVKVLTSPRRLKEELKGRAAVGEGEVREALAEVVGEGDFEKNFEAVFQEDPGWWRRKYGRRYQAEAGSHQVGEKVSDPSASGGEALRFDPSRHQPGYLLFGPYVNLAPQPWVACFWLKREGGKAGEEVAVLDVCCEKGEMILAREVVRAGDFPGEREYSEFRLSFRNDYLANQLEFRVNPTGLARLWCDEVSVFPDLKVWLREYRQTLPLEKQPDQLSGSMRKNRLSSGE